MAFIFTHFIFTFLDVVVGQSASILQLFARKDQTLLIRGNTFKNKDSISPNLIDLAIRV